MNPDLENWLKAGWLTQHKTSPREIADLLAVADRDLKSAESPGLDADWKHNIAYSSALNCAAAALAASGYRPSREQHHYRLIHSLPLVMGKELSKATDRLECARRKRNKDCSIAPLGRAFFPFSPAFFDCAFRCGTHPLLRRQRCPPDGDPLMHCIIDIIA